MSVASEAPRYRTLPLGGSLSATLTLRADGATLVESTEALGPYPARITDRFLHWAEVAPERMLVAKREHGGDWRGVTYAEALRRARGVAQALLDLGLSAERPVVILSDNDVEHLLLGLGALLAGVPYSSISPAYSLVSQDFGKLRHIVELLTPGLVFASGPAYAKAIAAVVPAETPVVLGEGSIEGRATRSFASLVATVPTAAVDAAHAEVAPDTIAKFLFTSGSTKLPKGVINTQRMLCANQQMILQCFPSLGEAPPVLVDWLPWNHTFGGNHNVGITLYNGGTLYIDEGKPTAALIGETLRNLREIAPTIYFNVPKGFEEIANALEVDPLLRKTLFSRVRMFFFSGAGLAQPVWDKLDRVAEQEIGERIKMITGLGMTETAPFAICANAHDVKSGHIGLPAPGLELKLVTMGDKQEVRYRGPNVTPGYWRAPQQTAACFDEEGFYCSGDAAKPMDPGHPERGFTFDGRIARRLQALDRHLCLGRSLACRRHRRRRPAGAGRGHRRHQPRRHRRAALSAPRRLPCARRHGRLGTGGAGASRRARARLLPAARRCALRARHRQRHARGAGAGAGRAAVDRPRRDHRQGLDQPAGGAGASRRRRAAPVRRRRRHHPAAQALTTAKPQTKAKR